MEFSCKFQLPRSKNHHPVICSSVRKWSVRTTLLVGVVYSGFEWSRSYPNHVFEIKIPNRKFLGTGIFGWVCKQALSVLGNSWSSFLDLENRWRLFFWTNFSESYDESCFWRVALYFLIWHRFLQGKEVLLHFMHRSLILQSLILLFCF